MLLMGHLRVKRMRYGTRMAIGKTFAASIVLVNHMQVAVVRSIKMGASYSAFECRLTEIAGQAPFRAPLLLFIASLTPQGVFTCSLA